MSDGFILTDDTEYIECSVKGQVIYSTANNQLFCNKMPDECKDALIAYCNSHNDFEPETPVYLINHKKTMAIMIVSIDVPFTYFIENLTHENADPQI